VLDSQGNIVGISKIARDISDRKRAEAALLRSEERLAQELAAITRLHELSMRLLSANLPGPALQDLLDSSIATCGADSGYIQLLEPHTGVLEIVVHRGFEPPFLEHVRTVTARDGSAWGRALKTGERVVVEDVSVDPRFEAERDVAAAAGFRAVQSTPLTGHDGQVLGVLSTHFRAPRRISEGEERLLDLYARHAGDLLERLRFEDALREAARRKDEFIAILAHELRNPLAPVRNAAHYLKLKDLGGADLRRAVDMIEKHTTLMSRLVDDLLDVSRITRGTLELRRERVVLSELVESAIEACRHEIDGRRHELRVSLPDAPIVLHADRARLMQVLCNLLTNAAKYSPDGGTIDLRAQTVDSGLLVSVRDRGAGIPPEKLEEIFDLFAQLDRTLERQGGGLGIGLTLSRQIARLHGGTLDAHSDGVGLGSEFVMRLPIVAPPSASRAGSAPTRTTTARRILVVDDNRDAADSLAMVLETTGHVVHRAYDGEAALQIAQRLSPDLVLLDIGMPKLNGYEVARRLREQPGGTRITLVALTGWGQEEDRQRAREAGFDHHLVKPATAESLDRLLARMAPVGIAG
jgi:signal transduction histidine kinase